jgi:hypothetical protein
MDTRACPQHRERACFRGSQPRPPGARVLLTAVRPEDEATMIAPHSQRGLPRAAITASWFLLLSWLAGCTSSPATEAPPAGLEGQSQAMFFGANDQLNVAQHPDARVGHWARSVGLLGVAAELCPGASDDCQPALAPVADGLPGRPDADPGLCEGEPYATESYATGGKCTAFYVGNNLFITADHCFDNVSCPDAGVLFDFETDALGNMPGAIAREDNFYRCKAIVSRDRGTGVNSIIDYAVFEVDRPVTGHPALALRRSGKLAAGMPSEAGPTRQYAVLGHQTLLPLKAAMNGIVRNNINTGWFYLTVDAGRGMSGGPIINVDEGFVEGIVVTGPPDTADGEADYLLRDDDACFVHRACGEGGCNAPTINQQWIAALRVTRAGILDFVPSLPSPPGEHVAIVLDQTGSMTESGTVPGLTRWDDAINAANLWLQADRLLATARGYSIWTFKSDAEQDGVVRVWPQPDSLDCSSFDEASGFCRVSSDAEYAALQDRLENMRESHRAVAGPSTPLASSLCDVVSEMAALPGLKRIVLESDGGENATRAAHACAGEDSQPFAAWELDLDDWGMSLDSWQARVIRRLARMSQAAFAAVQAGPLQPSDTIPADVLWMVDLHFGLSAPSALAAPPPAAFVLKSRALEQPSEARASRGLAALSISSLAAAPQPSAELDMLRELVAASPGSRLTQYEPLVDGTPGMDHAVAGDADDSGCVDLADYSLVTHASTWLTRALTPDSAAARADLTRDGWVNQQDVSFLVAQWGHGCAAPIAAPPSCHDGKQNHHESDVDCGGACGGCTLGARCESDADCLGDTCDAGSCACPAHMSQLFGSDGPDLLVGTRGPDCIAGFGGDDRIEALEGDDLVFGGEGRDTIAAGAGNDRVYGEAGDDVIDASHGDDLVLGQDGVDTCAGGTGLNALSCEVAAHCTAACCSASVCGL